MSRFCQLTDTGGGTYGLPVVRSNMRDAVVPFPTPVTRDGIQVTEDRMRPLSGLTEAQRQGVGYAAWSDEPVDAEAYDAGAPTDTLTAAGVARTYPGKVLKTGAAIDAYKKRAQADVDRAAEACRKQYTTGGEGQAMSYLVKVEEARDCVAKYAAGTYSGQNPPPAGTYPVLESEVGAGLTGADAKAVADVILARRALWVGIEKQINGLRMAAKRDIAAAADVPAVRAVVNAIQWPAP